MQTNRLIPFAVTAIAAIASGINAAADTKPDTWVGCDELGRIVPSSDNMDGGIPVPDDRVEIGMFYYIWHGTEDKMKTVYDISEILAANPDNPAWGSEHHYHWWGKPWLGYYDAGQHDVIFKHLQMLCDAGVDFIAFDCTNGLTYPDRINEFIKVVHERRDKGMRWPRLTFMTHARQESAIASLWDNFYSKPELSDLWYQWDGAPLLMCDTEDAANYPSLTPILENLTLRHSWAWTGGRENTWSWLDYYPQGIGYTMADGRKVPECISVGSAQHPTTNTGKSYSQGSQPQVSAQGVCDSTPMGLYFAEQWQRVHSLPYEERPPVVFLTQWNEFIAMRFTTGDHAGADPGKVRPGAKNQHDDESYFVDVYTAEFNRDLEPSTHPLFRDNYYMQMVEEIRKYRGTSPIPTPTRNIKIDINGPWEQWDAESLIFTDDTGDHMLQSVAQDKTCKSPGNDIAHCKVTKDKHNIYFLVATATDIVWDDTPRRMRLLLNTDCDYATGWQGYDYIIERDPSHGYFTLKKSTAKDKFEWETVKGKLDARFEGSRLMIALPKSAVKRKGDFDFDFKWVDNCNLEAGEPMLMYSDGDCAPNHRFNYRFKGSSTTNKPEGKNRNSISVH